MAVNSDLIKSIEAPHDTVITLLTGEKLVVLESADEVIASIIAFRRAILSSEPLAASLPHPCVSSKYLRSRLDNDSEDK